MQDGDVYLTYADSSELISNYDYKPSVPISLGVQKFVEWFKDYKKVV